MAEMNKRNVPEHAASVVWYECPNRCGYDVEWYDDNSGTWCTGCFWAGWGDELKRGVTPGGLEHSTGTAMVMYDAKDREGGVVMAGEADETTGATDAQIETAEGIVEALCRPGEPVSAFHVSRYVLAAVIPPGAVILSPDDVARLRAMLGDTP